VKILHYVRLQANGFVSVKITKQTQNCTNIFESRVKILGTKIFWGWTEPEAQKFVTPQWIMSKTEAD